MGHVNLALTGPLAIGEWICEGAGHLESFRVYPYLCT